MSEENNKPNDDLSREEINDELDKLINKINEEFDKSTEDEIFPDDMSNWLCYSVNASIRLWEKLKGNNKNDDDGNCPPPQSNDSYDDNSDTPKEE